MPRERKITIGEMRESGPTRLIVYCGDYRCAHSITMDPDLWPGNLALGSGGSLRLHGLRSPRRRCPARCLSRRAWAQTPRLFEPLALNSALAPIERSFSILRAFLVTSWKRTKRRSSRICWPGGVGLRTRLSNPQRRLVASRKGVPRFQQKAWLARAESRRCTKDGLPLAAP